ncbi:CsiV family protein [Oceanicoccus sp. KOV_DT_Chl]|uniref:CsiV family protein n=1 Tax=Oceanicoccus sp. KOV_DT_Chl TaxID=1904639 RepID=UPI00135A40E8|nr:CsiV family protein [Oceanicoccus sp. KOV_DT_Chl]
MSIQAQPSVEVDIPKWYQIEVLIFAYQRDNSQQELWPQELGLKYPQRILQLKQATANQVIINEPIPPMVSVFDRTFSEDTTPADATITESDVPANEPVVDNNKQLLNDSESTVLPVMTVELEEQPFTLLAKEEMTFQTIAKRLAAQRNIRQLFHAAWRQPIRERDTAESILIRGGDQYDNHFELEGSLSIGLERYLHISTDLWLSNFVSNAGLDKTPWPVLPPIPITSKAVTSSLTPSGDPFLNSAQNNLFSDQTFSFDNPFIDTAGNLFSVAETITLRQERRMRSQELHYIDHPLMGLLVRITPYEKPLSAETPLPTTNISEQQN